MSHSVTHLSLYVILVSKLFLCPSCSHTQPTENTTAYTCLKCLFYMHSLTVHNCINVSMFLSSLFFVVCVICVVRSVVPVPVDRHLRRVVSLHPGVADSNDIHHNTSATPTLRTVLTVTGTARRTDTFDIILFHAHTPVTDYIVRVYSAHGRLVFLCKLRCCVTDIPYAFVHRTHLIHRSFVRRLALVYVLLSNSDHIFPLPLEDEDVFILKSPLHSTERLSQLR